MRRATRVCPGGDGLDSNFYPRSPCGERHRWLPRQCVVGLISIHALLAESDPVACLPESACFISIHALLAESDRGRAAVCADHRDFYPRSPCGERRVDLIHKHNQGQFLSTLSLRRATLPQSSWRPKWENFYPRSPCGERRGYFKVHSPPRKISIHALLAESDCRNTPPPRPRPDFYPRSPCGERPLRYSEQSAPPKISIHALLAESDNAMMTLKLKPITFLSTLSLRRATRKPCKWGGCGVISIHALLAESDHGSPGVRRQGRGISIHALLAESDLPGSDRPRHAGISIHALLAESDTG